jgi:ABC-type amino acid transport substrate-binding protein
MKRTGSAAIVAGVVGMAALAATQADARSLDAILASGEIRFCVAPYGPVIGTVEPEGCLGEDCQFEGPLKSVTDAFAASLGDNVSAAYRILTWDEQFQNAEGQTVRDADYAPGLFASQQCDMFPTYMLRNDWRQRKMSQPVVFPVRKMVIINRDNVQAIRGPDDLAGRVAAVMPSSWQEDWIRDQNNGPYEGAPVEMQVRPTIADTLAEVDEGRVDFALLSSEDALWFTRHALKNSMAAFPFGDMLQASMGVPKESPDLLAAFEAFWAAQRADEASELNVMWRETFGLAFPKYLRLLTQIK